MIRKFLICGNKQIHLQSKNLESYRELGHVIELNIPLEDYWELEKDLKEANYLMASGEAPAEVNVALRRILQQSLKHVVKEKDRSWVHEKLRTP